MNKKITETLIFLSVPTDYSGFHDIEDAVSMACESDELYGRMTKVIYPDIAKKRKKSPKAVEKNIRTAIDYSWNHANPANLRKVFGDNNRFVKRRPTTMEFVAAVKEYSMAE